MPTGRPAFSAQLSLQEFDSHYWYKEELAAICREQKLSAGGTKAELLARVRLFLKTGKRERVSVRNRVSLQRKRSDVGKPITLATRLIADGFKFDQRARDFFAKHYGVQKFHFTKQMAEALRAAEARQDLDLTVRDLLKVYEKAEELKANGQPASRTKEEKTYQWNHFVRAFHRDPRTKALGEPLKVAALLWRSVRERPGSKKYSPALLKKFSTQIARYRASCLESSSAPATSPTCTARHAEREFC